MIDASIECPGWGKCHGSLKWCSQCGDVSLHCDARRCDTHNFEGVVTMAKKNVAFVQRQLLEKAADLREALKEQADAEKTLSARLQHVLLRDASDDSLSFARKSSGK